MQFQRPAEVISNDHRVLTNVEIVYFEEEKNYLYTLIPRSLNGSPVSFSTEQVYNLVYTSYQNIHFFKVSFKDLAQYKGKPVYDFQVLEYKCVDNLRKEERKNVEYQAVVSDFNQIGFVTILDISYSGLKIETDYEITSEFIEVFFDEENIPRRAMGRITWEKHDIQKDLYYYGVELRYR
ncbi:PilZ domain-containing protein [Priestia megaterium]|uniref:PilZ domain-containing protein n=1 Tax=Priestia megaterium TaxID=1404 RepID=A0A6M6E5N6_PRIMG|nr:PilZ domain-containing protein [Priestia megaterium]QJX80856.1 hypothetical protein FDZ14_32725 [Priestia megaterium]